LPGQLPAIPRSAIAGLAQGRRYVYTFSRGVRPGRDLRYLAQIYTAFEKGLGCNSLRRTRLYITCAFGSAAGGGVDASDDRARADFGGFVRQLVFDAAWLAHQGCCYWSAVMQESEVRSRDKKEGGA